MGEGVSYHSRKPTKPIICNLALVGSASHWSDGPPAAAMSEKAMSPVSFHGKHVFDCTQKPTKPAIATRPCLISAWRRKPMVASLDWPQNSISASGVGL